MKTYKKSIFYEITDELGLESIGLFPSTLSAYNYILEFSKQKTGFITQKYFIWELTNFDDTYQNAVTTLKKKIFEYDVSTSTLTQLV